MLEFIEDKYGNFKVTHNSISIGGISLIGDVYLFAPSADPFGFMFYDSKELSSVADKLNELNG